MVTAARRRLVAGNWKMNGNRAANASLLHALVEAVPFACDVSVCAPFPYLGEVGVQLGGSGIAWGGQDCSVHAAGAYTGEIAAPMLVEFGCRHVIVGHSERRALHGESDRLVGEKAKAAIEAGLEPIVCVGETLEERERGSTEDVVRRQLGAVLGLLGADAGRIVVAYEPVWAIGTGRTATPEQAAAVHATLRQALGAAGAPADEMRIVYGGSVKADNAAQLFAEREIDGGLIGGASLKADEFIAICRAASSSQNTTSP